MNLIQKEKGPVWKVQWLYIPKDVAVTSVGSFNQMYETMFGDIKRKITSADNYDDKTFEDIFTGYTGALFATHDGLTSKGIKKRSFIDEAKRINSVTAFKKVLKNNFIIPTQNWINSNYLLIKKKYVWIYK